MFSTFYLYLLIEFLHVKMQQLDDNRTYTTTTTPHQPHRSFDHTTMNCNKRRGRGASHRDAHKRRSDQSPAPRGPAQG